MFAKLKAKRRAKRIKKLKAKLAKISPSEQVGIAVGLIGSIAVNHPRDQRRKFIASIVSLLNELIKTQTVKKGDENATKH